MNIESYFHQIIPSTVQGIQQEYKSFIGYKIQERIEIHPPNDDVHSKGQK
jgi:hypothetical protein